jgi:PAS domain S-box-containing protein
LRQDGSQVPIEIGLNPITTSEGGFVLVSIIDITERKRAEEQFRLVVEASPNALLLVNRAGRISLVNTQAEKLFGYSRQELLGQPVEMLVPSQFHVEHRGYRDVFLKSPTPRAMGAGRDLFGVHKDGSQIPIEIGLNPITTAAGSFILTSIIDITERKRAEEQIRYQANLVENVSDAIIATDINFVITSWNKAAETIYGWPAQEVLGQPSTAVLKTEYIENSQRQQIVGQLFETGQWTGEVIQQHKDGAAIYILASISLLNDRTGQPVGVVTVNRDISDRKQAEESLRQSQDNFARAFNSSPAALAITRLADG